MLKYISNEHLGKYSAFIVFIEVISIESSFFCFDTV